MRESSSFANFCRAFTAEWFTAMSGGLSVPLVILAVYVDNPPLKIGLGLTAVVCFVFASFRIWKMEREARIDAESKVNTRETRKNIRIVLSGYNEEGRVLISRCKTEIHDPPPIADANSWAHKVETFLRDNLDESYISRFRDDTGILGVAVIPSPPEAHLILLLWIRVRVINLNKFVEECSGD
jgi:hypothetical protein